MAKTATDHMHRAIWCAKRGERFAFWGLQVMYLGLTGPLGAVVVLLGWPEAHAPFLACLAWGALLMALGSWVMTRKGLHWHIISRYHFFTALGEDPCEQGCLMCTKAGAVELPECIRESRRELVAREMNHR